MQNSPIKCPVSSKPEQSKAMSAMKNKSNHHDEAVIYYSQEDSSWIAHSLSSDQMGFGESVIEALADLLKALRQVHELADADPSIQIQPAPQEIRNLAQNARRLPGEMLEIASLIASGKKIWPEGWQLPEPSNGSKGPWQVDPSALNKVVA